MKCDELKPITVTDECGSYRVYNKSDVDAAIAELKQKLQDHCTTCPVKENADKADKVIAVLEENHKKEVGQLLMEIAELKKGAKNLILDNYLKDKEARHANYKRCLAMAKWCDKEEYDAEDYHDEHRAEWAIKWFKKWLELAEKFKEAK